jgi:hypothetical protein
MSTITYLGTTTQVRPWPAGGGWNNVNFAANRIPLKTTTWGITLTGGGQVGAALRAVGAWLDAGNQGTPTRTAQKIMHALGLELSEAGQLSNAQAGNGVSTNVLDRGVPSGPGTVAIVTVAGATPTVTLQMEGSADNTTFVPLSTADSGTPTTFSTATFNIVSATTTTRVIDPAAQARYIRITYSANTNMTMTATVQAG